MAKYRPNPTLMQAGYQKFWNQRFAGGKFYRGKWVNGGHVYISRRQFRRAHEADEYAQRVLARYRSLRQAEREVEQIDG